MTISLCCIDKSDYQEFTSKSAGYRGDVYVEINNKLYHILFYDIVRLNQDFNDQLKDQGYYITDPNLVILSEVTSENLISIIPILYREGYFSKVVPIDMQEVRELNLVKMAEVNMPR